MTAVPRPLESARMLGIAYGLGKFVLLATILGIASNLGYGWYNRIEVSVAGLVVLGMLAAAMPRLWQRFKQVRIDEYMQSGMSEAEAVSTFGRLFED